MTEKQALFVEEYLVDLNATQAAIRAGYSTRTAYSQGQRLLKSEEIQEAIQKAMQERSERTCITQDRVLEELAAIAFANGSDFARVVEKPVKDPLTGTVVMDPETGKPRTYRDVELIPTDDLPEEKKKALAGIKWGKNGIEVASCDKLRALDMLGRHLGMFTDKVETTGNVAVEVIYDYGDED